MTITPAIALLYLFHPLTKTLAGAEDLPSDADDVEVVAQAPEAEAQPPEVGRTDPEELG